MTMTGIGLLTPAHIEKAAGASMPMGMDMTWLVLAANSGDITGATLVTVMTITGVGIGRYHYRCQLVYQTTATTTGINVGVNHTGTTTQFVQEARFISTGSAAATKVASEIDQATTLGLYEAEANRTKNTAIGTTTNFIVGVDTANADLICTIEGFFVVSVSGDLEIKLGAETTALVARACQGSFLELEKLS